MQMCKIDNILIGYNGIIIGYVNPRDSWFEAFCTKQMDMKDLSLLSGLIGFMLGVSTTCEGEEPGRGGLNNYR